MIIKLKILKDTANCNLAENFRSDAGRWLFGLWIALPDFSPALQTYFAPFKSKGKKRDWKRAKHEAKADQKK